MQQQKHFFQFTKEGVAFHSLMVLFSLAALICNRIPLLGPWVTILLIATIGMCVLTVEWFQRRSSSRARKFQAGTFLIASAAGAAFLLWRSATQLLCLLPLFLAGELLIGKKRASYGLLLLVTVTSGILLGDISRPMEVAIALAESLLLQVLNTWLGARHNKPRPYWFMAITLCLVSLILAILALR